MQYQTLVMLSSHYDIKQLIVDSVASIWGILRFVFSHPIMCIKHPSMFPAFREKRKAITLEIKLKMIAQLQANISILNRNVRQARLSCDVG